MKLRTIVDKICCFIFGDVKEDVITHNGFSSLTINEYKHIKPNEYKHGGNISDELALLGAILGDIIGSSYELKGTRIKTTEFELFPDSATYTDDTVMTVAVAKWLSKQNCIPKDSKGLVEIMKEIGNRYMEVGYGHSFKQWLKSDSPKPYGSFGNGSAMRVAAAGLFGQSLEECQQIARITAGVSHNHIEGIKGAEAVASAIRMAKCHYTKDCIKKYIESKYRYNLSRSLDEIRPNYSFDPTCQGSVPEAIICFLESTDMESAIRNAVSLGGDADTQACIAGAIAGAYYGSMPEAFWKKIQCIIPEEFVDILSDFVGYNNLLEKTICEDPQEDKDEILSMVR